MGISLPSQKNRPVGPVASRSSSHATVGWQALGGSDPGYISVLAEPGAVRLILTSRSRFSIAAATV